jgi:hypothetical protein
MCPFFYSVYVSNCLKQNLYFKFQIISEIIAYFFHNVIFLFWEATSQISLIYMKFFVVSLKKTAVAFFASSLMRESPHYGVMCGFHFCSSGQYVSLYPEDIDADRSL